MKKLTALFLAAATLFTLAASAYAEENTAEDYMPSQSIETELEAAQTDIDFLSAAPDAQPQVSDEPDFIDGGNEEDGFITDNLPVAILYLCASGPHAPYAFGHAWICIKNISDREITVGTETVEPGKMISAGLHHDGGLHFNDEMKDYDGKMVSAKSTYLFEDDLSKAENEILKDRWSWYELFAHNCTNFATAVWKATTGKGYAVFCFPFIVQLQMAFGGTEKIEIINDN